MDFFGSIGKFVEGFAAAATGKVDEFKAEIKEDAVGFIFDTVSETTVDFQIKVNPGEWIKGMLSSTFKTDMTSIEHPEAIVFSSLYKIILPIGILIGLGGVIAAGYMFMTSQGSPDRVKAGQEQLTSAITGALFIALSLGILKFIIGSLL